MAAANSKGTDADKTVPSTAQDGGYGWFIVVAAFCVQFCMLGTLNNVGMLNVELIDTFDSSTSKVSWIGSIAYGFMFFSGPVVTSAVDRFGCRFVGVVGALICGLATLASSFSTSVDLLFVTYGVLFGVGASLCYFPSVIILAQFFSRRLSLVNGLVSAGSGAGTMVFAKVYQVIIRNYNWRMSLRVSAGVMMFVALVSLAYRIGPNVVSSGGGGKRKILDLSVFNNRAYIVLVLSLSIFMLGYFVPFVHLANMARMYDVPKEKASLLVGFMSIASLCGRLFFGNISDLPGVNRLFVYQFSLLCIGLSHTFIPLCTTYGALIGYTIGFGFFEGCYVCLCAVLTADVLGRSRMASGIGLLFGIKSLPLMLGPPLAGFIFDTTNSYHVAFLVSGAVTTLASIMMFSIPFLLPPPNHPYWKNTNEPTKNLDCALLMSEPASREAGEDLEPPKIIQGTGSNMDIPRQINTSELKGSQWSLAAPIQ